MSHEHDQPQAAADEQDQPQAASSIAELSTALPQGQPQAAEDEVEPSDEDEAKPPTPRGIPVEEPAHAGRLAFLQTITSHHARQVRQVLNKK